MTAFPAGAVQGERGGLTDPREREVMAFLVKGLLNKQVSAELGTTLPIVKFHRAHVMQKMKAGSIADLVRISRKAGSALRRVVFDLDR